MKRSRGHHTPSNLSQRWQRREALMEAFTTIGSLETKTAWAKTENYFRPRRLLTEVLGIDLRELEAVATPADRAAKGAFRSLDDVPGSGVIRHGIRTPQMG